MPRRPPTTDDSDAWFARETSPFFSLPNENGSKPHPDDAAHDQHQHQYPPITLSCAHCERIVGDSSGFVCATREMRTITLDRMVSVDVGLDGLKTSLEGEWDEFCNYKDISCGKCATALGKMYFATTTKLSALQNKFTLNILSISFYRHDHTMPSLPIAATAEIYSRLHPSRSALVEDIDNIRTFCVMLREEQGDIIRELRKLGNVAGVDVDLEERETEAEAVAARESWREKVRAMEEVVERVKRLEEMVAERGREQGGKRKVSMVGKEQGDMEKTKRSGGGERTKEPRMIDAVITEPPPPPLPLHSPPPPQHQKKKYPPTTSTRKRKSTSETHPPPPQRQVINLLEDSAPPRPPPPPPPPPPHRKSRKEVPNSQSTAAGDEDASETPAQKRNSDVYEEVIAVEPPEAEEVEPEEEQIKSPAEKRRKGAVAVAIDRPRKENAGRRESRRGKRYVDE